MINARPKRVELGLAGAGAANLVGATATQRSFVR